MDTLGLSDASNHNLAQIFFGIGFLFVAIKLASAVIQNVLSRGNYRNHPTTWTFRMAYVAGKATPAFAAACFCLGAFFRHDRKDALEYGMLAVGVAILAIIVVRLRNHGRFFGVFGIFSKRQQGR